MTRCQPWTTVDNVHAPLRLSRIVTKDNLNQYIGFSCRRSQTVAHPTVDMSTFVHPCGGVR